MEHASVQHYSFIKLDVAGGPLSIINAFISDELLKWVIETYMLAEVIS